MVDIKCLVCGKTVKLPQFIDIDNYDGQVVCPKCKALLHVKIVQGKVQKYKIVKQSEPIKEPIKVEYIMPNETNQNKAK
jgi:uncharacterized Zn finger protein (UPF0148 family)